MPHATRVTRRQVEEVATSCEVNAMPTFLLYVNGERRETVQGAKLPELEKMIASI